MHTIQITRSSLLRLAAVLFVGLLLAGCGNQLASAGRGAAVPPATPTKPAPIPAAAQPTAAVTPTPASSPTSQATATPAPAANTPLPPATPTIEVNWLEVSGKTEAGLAYLGNPDAPVTLIDYADFM